jgi:hypothetical protein
MDIEPMGKLIGIAGRIDYCIWCSKRKILKWQPYSCRDFWGSCRRFWVETCYLIRMVLQFSWVSSCKDRSFVGNICRAVLVLPLSTAHCVVVRKWHDLWISNRCAALNDEVRWYRKREVGISLTVINILIWFMHCRCCWLGAVHKQGNRDENCDAPEVLWHLVYYCR